MVSTLLDSGLLDELEEEDVWANAGGSEALTRTAAEARETKTNREGVRKENTIGFSTLPPSLGKLELLRQAAGYARTEMPEKVMIARPRIGTPNALAGSNTLLSSWLAI